MPKCQPGCTCGRHRGHVFVSREESEDRHRELTRTWQQDNRERLAEGARVRRAADPEPERAAGRKWRAANRDKFRAIARESMRKHGYRLRLWSYYRLTPEQYTQLVEQQDGCCYLCAEPLDLETPRNVHVDHDHRHCRGERSCGTCILGIACRSCNIGCGMFGDDPDRMERIAAVRRGAMAEAALRVAALPVQGELPLSVVPIDRKARGA